ncbi:hypothetical protein BT69DRAFT_1310518 [Atractiella rhizophila]|nr:hypothetical protein BT69DRAFT_1310518 [Atractiella rhizophila]
MIEAEDICLSAADHRLYFSVGFSLIQCIKSLMTFEPEDLDAAIHTCRDSVTITQLLRKRDHSTIESFGRFVKGTSSVNTIRNMTVVQRHAELVYAECVLLKAILGIIYSGDFLAFLKEALNMRNAYAIYRQLARFVDEADNAAKGGKDEAIDQDFRSGVFLGNGLISLILSLLPGKVLKMMEVFGFTGEREYALKTLMKAGGWMNGKKEPSMKAEEEGIRRQICDMALLFYFLVISTYLPVTGVDIELADAILHYNLARYPQGVFFLYFSGRLYATRTESERAVKQFNLAIKAQREYIQLQHICLWDMALTNMANYQFASAYDQLNILAKESNWSKAIYAYAKAVMLYETGDKEKATAIMKTVPDLMQRIAGKSIPLEKFVARRSKKYLQNGNRLICPGVELAYVLNCLGMAPRRALFEDHLDAVSVAITELHEVKDPNGYGETYWDDFCVAHLLRGIILHFIAHPDSHTRPDPPESQIPVAEADEQAQISYTNILKHGKDITEDHHLVWFAHHQLGRLYATTGEYQKAKTEFDIVMSGKIPEIGQRKQKGKVSLQNMVVLRTNAALQKLQEEKKI